MYGGKFYSNQVSELISHPSTCPGVSLVTSLPSLWHIAHALHLLAPTLLKWVLLNIPVQLLRDIRTDVHWAIVLLLL